MKPLYSVIIISHNNFDETTRGALESLSEDDEYSDLREVLVIDNGSNDQTLNKLKMLEDISPFPKLFLEKSNLGFPRAANLGISLAQGKYIVLLNSDTKVMPGTLLKLTQSLDENPSFGAISPVTNSAGNEQHILLKENDSGKVLKLAKHWIKNVSPKLITSQRLDFCCVAIPKVVFEKVGVLDEEFSPGYFEDFDFCIRLAQNNFKMGVLETAFVYHEGGASFSRKPKSTRKLIKNNKKKILAKHGIVNFLHRRECNMKVLQSYYERLGAKDEFAYPFFKRLGLACSDYPKGWLKKKKYSDHLLSISRDFNDRLIQQNENLLLGIDEIYGKLVKRPDTSNYNGSQTRDEFLLTLLYIEHRIRELESDVVSFLEIGAFKGLWAIALDFLCKKHNKNPFYVTATWLKHNPENEDLIRVCQDIETRGFASAKIIDGNSADPKVIETVHKTRKTYDFVLIDADHSVEAVQKDIQSYSHLASEILLFHDVVTKKCGVRKAIENSGLSLHYIISRAKEMGIGLRDNRLPSPLHKKISKVFCM